MKRLAVVFVAVPLVLTALLAHATNPEEPQSKNVELVGQIDGSFHNVIVQDNYAYATGASSLHLINVTTPTALVETGAYNSPKPIYNLDIYDHYVYLAGQDGIQIVDVSNPYDPQIAGTYDTENYTIWGIFTDGTRAYAMISAHKECLKYCFNGLLVFNISNPTSPTRMYAKTLRATGRSYYLSGPIPNLFILGDYAYVPYEALWIVDATDSWRDAVGYYGPPDGYVNNVYTAEDYAYVVTNWFPGLHVLDVSDPTVPMRVGSYDALGGAYDVFVQGSYAYVAYGAAGMRALDIHSPEAPAEVGFYDTPGSSSAVFAANHYVYLIDYDSRFMVLKFTGYDFNDDGQVNARDIQDAAAHWRKDSTSPHWGDINRFDTDGNETINIQDIMRVSAAWGPWP